MTTNTKPKQTLVGIELVRLLEREGDLIFTTARARELAPRVGMKDAYVVEALRHLRKNGRILPLKRGLYAVCSDQFPGLPEAVEYEIATRIVQPAMISHWSAMNFHHLSLQIPRDIFVTTTQSRVPPLPPEIRWPGQGYVVRSIKYRVVQVKPELFFGVEKEWYVNSYVPFTNLERTLVDGLYAPQYCGTFGEVHEAFEEAIDLMDLERLTKYAVRMGAPVAKRLGWMLEYLDAAPQSTLDKLAALPVKGCPKLDPSRPRRGPYNSRWNLLENM